MKKTQKEVADYFLYDCGLLNELQKYGAPHIIGSYMMDLMVKNDLDIDVENTDMSREKLYMLTDYILHTFKPIWYEAKEEVTDEGKTVWFHGFEIVFDSEIWNFDIWFFDNETIEKAESYCFSVADALRFDDEARKAILQIKAALIEKGIYSFYQYNSMDVYDAVLRFHIRDAASFLQTYQKRR